MAKKFGSRNDKKESHSSQRYEQKPGGGKGSENVGSYQQKDHGRSMAGGDQPDKKDWMADGGNKSYEKELGADGGSKSNEDWLADGSQSKEGKWVPSEAPKKDGCFPKLFALLIPFIAVGAYLYLAS